MFAEVLISLPLFVAAPQQQAGDAGARAAELRDRARRSARLYERVLRTETPRRFGGGAGPCVEIVGRYCLTDSDPEESAPPATPPAVAAARDSAIDAFRRWIAVASGDEEAAGPLVRYLVEAARPGEAVAVARAHAWAAERAWRSLMLVGLALHYRRDFEAAEAVFDSARSTAPADTVAILDDVAVLLRRDERRRYEALDSAGREEYHRRFWALADPVISDRGNERRSGHYARHAWIRILSRAPVVSDMTSWGRDQEELLLRYGVPVGRERIIDTRMSLGSDVSLVEWYDTRSRRFVPPALLADGVPEPGDPAAPWELDPDTSRSAYVPVHADPQARVRPVVHQVSRFPTRPGALVRIDGWVAAEERWDPAPALDRRTPDRGARGPAGEVLRPVDPTVTLVVLDTIGREVARAAGIGEIGSDGSVQLSAAVRLEDGDFTYHIELYDPATGLLALARHRLRVEPMPAIALSDPLLARPLPPLPGLAPASAEDTLLRPFADLVFAPGDTLGIYLEVSGLLLEGGAGRYTVEWWLEPAERPSLLARAARWVGERLGLAGSSSPVKIRWEGGSEGGADPVWLTVGLGGLEPGLYRLAVEVTDARSGRSESVGRLLRVRAGG